MRSVQWIPIKTNSDNVAQPINLGSGETKYSNPIFQPSSKPFAWFGVHVVADDGVTIEISIQYKFPDQEEYADAIILESGSGLALNNETKVKYYRLDAMLAENWIPNIQTRYKFREQLGIGGSAVINGIHSI